MEYADLFLLQMNFQDYFNIEDLHKKLIGASSDFGIG